MKAINTAKIVVGYLALVFFLAWLCAGCSTARREGTTSPCWTTKHMVGYSFGGWGKGRMH
jgi:hypothetical protein